MMVFLNHKGGRKICESLGGNDHNKNVDQLSFGIIDLLYIREENLRSGGQTWFSHNL